MSYQEIIDDRNAQVVEGLDAPVQATDPADNSTKTTKLQTSIQSETNIQHPQPEIPPNALRVLITGFGPFLHHEVNPSWLAVKPLHNTILYTEPGVPTLQPVETFSQSRQISSQSKSKGKGSDDGQSSDKGSTKGSSKATPAAPSGVEEFIFSTEPRPIHITCLRIPVVYESVLEIVPGLHARPPNIPTELFAELGLPVPEPIPQAFDFMFHIGVAGRGPLRMERLGHKFGYHMKDASGRYAQVVKVQSKDFSRQNAGIPGVAPPIPGSPGGMSASASNNWQSGSLHGSLTQGPNFGEGGVTFGEGSGDIFARPTRGFGLPYDAFPDEITTDIDVTRLVYDLKKNGVEQIYTSMDAGHYLCDFIYYCSLAEAQRASKAKAAATQLWDPKRAITGPSYAAYSSPYTSPPLGSNTPNYSFNSGPALYSPATGATPGDGSSGTQRPTQVLFLHCPPVNQPLSTEEVTEAIRKIVVWVCGEIVREDEYAAKQAEAANQPQTTATGKDR
ncbi:hypothetical protein CVT24_005525 [Panaeolus cyanescens]|uniref:Peptidase C15, pyroglutamyl peptidase I-like protein n=1 Tax=Panaeolus cyanescens TaxID=181874 RepID=A0A409YBY0_9AGAR|nr:hypothetical protein CVT24_005525 [Panaeolus cyanescens]